MNSHHIERRKAKSHTKNKTKKNSWEYVEGQIASLERKKVNLSQLGPSVRTR